MLRPSKAPMLPTTPGEWLRCFRYRVHSDDSASTLQQLSQSLGVSAKTIRRWETGQARPSQQDLQNFAEYFLLTPLQQTFLTRAYSNMRYGAAAARDSERLQQQAEPLLSPLLPGYLLDRLFYVCAWNSYVTEVEPVYEREQHANFLGRVLAEPHFREGAVDHPSFVRHLLETMWIGTGRICGSPGYVKMVNELSRIPDFRDLWCSLALEDAGSLPIQAPQDLMLDGGTFRVFCAKIEFPPVSYLVQYVPVDAAAWDRLAALRWRGPPAVELSPTLL